MPGHWINLKICPCTSEAINIISNICVLLILILFCWGLNMKLNRKVKLLFGFALGTLFGLSKSSISTRVTDRH